MSGVKTAGRGRRVAVLTASVTLAAVLTAAGAWWWLGRGGGPPGPPTVTLDGADPAVASAVTAARGRVLRDPTSAPAWGALGEVLLANQFPADADVCLARAETLDPAEPRWPYLRAWELLPSDRDAAVEAFGARRRTVQGRRPVWRRGPTATCRNAFKGRRQRAGRRSVSPCAGS